MPKTELNIIIRDRRISLGLTLDKVAKELGVNRTTVYRWEEGRFNTIKRSHIYLLSKILYLPIEVLLGYENDKPIEEPEVVKKRLEVIDSLNSIKSKEDLEQVEKYIDVFILKK